MSVNQEMTEQQKKILTEPYDPTIGKERKPVQQPYFDEEMKGKHFQYTYDNGWDYEFYVPDEYRIIYKISGGPMQGRNNWQETFYQRIRKNVWQVNWLEETGTVVSLVIDQDEMRVSTLIAFSQGHWEHPEDAHGYKVQDLERWRNLSKIGISTNRYLLPEQATLNKIYDGPGDLPLIDNSWNCY